MEPEPSVVTDGVMRNDQLCSQAALLDSLDSNIDDVLIFFRFSDSWAISSFAREDVFSCN